MSNTLSKEFVQELQNQLFEESKDFFSDLENSLIELERSENIEARKKILRTLHSIKGSSRAVGFEALASYAHQLETSISNSTEKFDYNHMFQALDRMIEHVNLLKQNKIIEANRVLECKK